MSVEPNRSLVSLLEELDRLPGVRGSLVATVDGAYQANERGAFDDLPLAQIVADFHTTYPGWMPGAELHSRLEQADFLADVARETAPGG